MTNFINYVFNFFLSIYYEIFDWIDNNVSNLNGFFDKQILNGTLLSVDMTYGELLIIVLPIITLFFFIILIFKLFKGMIGLFTK